MKSRKRNLLMQTMISKIEKATIIVIKKKRRAMTRRRTRRRIIMIVLYIELIVTFNYVEGQSRK